MPIGRLFRVNLSKSGVSLGIGPRGFNVNIGPRGIRRTVGIPGTGIYYQDSQSWPRTHEAAAAPETVAPADGGFPWVKIVIGLAFGLFAVKACDPAPTTRGQSAPPVTAEPAGAVSATTAAGEPARIPPRASELPDRALTADEVKELQALLARSGFSPGPVDGKLGPRTRAAVRKYRKQSAAAATGDPTLATLLSLRVGGS